MFQTRNAYYLRITSNVVLPLYLYLDERHLEWMSDRVLQYVLTDLRPLVAIKLQAEAEDQFSAGASSSSKKGSVDVKRGDFYQFAYFLRKTEPHSVLVKARTFTAAPQGQPLVQRAQANDKQTGKRKPPDRSPASAKGGKKRKTRRRVAAQDSDAEDAAMSTGEDSDEFTHREPVAERPVPRRVTRANKATTSGSTNVDDDVEMTTGPMTRTTAVAPELVNDDSDMIATDEATIAAQSTTEFKQELQDTPLPIPLDQPQGADDVELDIEEEEAKPKPILRLKYQGFNILGSCLCVVVEPWPPVRASRAPSVAPIFSNAARAPSIAPPSFTTSESARRERTPLFLPDPDRGRSETPLPFAHTRVLPQVPLFDAEPEDNETESGEEGDLISFSQSLNYAGDARGGEEDDEIDGAVFFGDADEAREF